MRERLLFTTMVATSLVKFSTETVSHNSVQTSGNSSLSLKDYELNVEKTLRKKLEATERHSVEYKFTHGGVTATAE